MMLYLTSIKFN